MKLFMGFSFVPITIITFKSNDKQLQYFEICQHLHWYDFSISVESMLVYSYWCHFSVVWVYNGVRYPHWCNFSLVWVYNGVGTFGDPPNLTLTHLTRRLTLKLFRLGWKELVMGGYCVQKQPRGSRLSLPDKAWPPNQMRYGIYLGESWGVANTFP